MDIIIIPLITVLLLILRLYTYAVFAYVILGWLENFNIVNRYNSFVYTVHTFLFRLVEPAMAPIRGVLPAMGGLDMSPLVLLLAIFLLQSMLAQLALHFPH